MKKLDVVFLVTATGIALLLLVICSLPRPSSSAMAAPNSDHDPFEQLLNADYAPLYQGEQFTCTVTYTTTDSLENVNACPVGERVDYCVNQAAPLASYDGLALIAETGVPEIEEREVAVHEDWFRLDNAEVGARYIVEALPSRTVNYNLGIVVYDQTYTAILTDTDYFGGYTSRVILDVDSQGPYFFRVFQITPNCTGRTYQLDASKVVPTATPTSTPRPGSEADDYEPNDSFEEAVTLPIQVPILLELTFHSEDDRDYFRFYGKWDRWYHATTSDLYSVDTLVEIYDDRVMIARDDDGAGGYASRATWQADYDGYYYVVVQNNVDSIGLYNLTLDEAPPPTPGPSPTPGPKSEVLFLPVVLRAYPSPALTPTPETPTPTPGFVESEPNNHFDQADVVGAPWSIYGSAWNSITDTDFFVLDTQIGREYAADLFIHSPDGLELRVNVYNVDGERVGSSSFSSSRTDLSWTADAPIHYVQVDPLAFTGLDQTAQYRLDVNIMAATPTPTVMPTPTPTSTPWGDTLMRVEPAEQTVNPGATFAVAVTIENVADFGGYEFEMAFDPSVIEVWDVGVGGFLGSSGRPVAPFGPEVDNELGMMTFGAISFGDAPGPDGSGDVAVITMEAVGTGVTTLDLRDVRIIDTIGEEIEATVEDGEVQVAPYPTDTPGATATSTAVPTATPRPTSTPIVQ